MGEEKSQGTRERLYLHAITYTNAKGLRAPSLSSALCALRSALCALRSALLASALCALAATRLLLQ